MGYYMLLLVKCIYTNENDAEKAKRKLHQYYVLSENRRKRESEKGRVGRDKNRKKD